MGKGVEEKRPFVKNNSNPKSSVSLTLIHDIVLELIFPGLRVDVACVQEENTRWKIAGHTEALHIQTER